MAGEVLKQRREALGFEIKDVADHLKIKKSYLQAIEEDAFDELPVSVYTLGYIRAYARYLDIDSDQIVEYFSSHLSRPKSSAIMPVAFSKPRRSFLWYLVPVAAVVAFSITFFAGYLQDQSLLPSAPVQPKTIIVPQPVTMPPAPVQAPEPLVKDTPPAAPVPVPVTQSPEPGEHSLDIRAHATTWISVKYRNGKHEEILLRQGDAQRLKFSDSMVIKIGNAGGISLVFDGKDIGSVGRPGQVVTMNFPLNQ